MAVNIDGAIRNGLNQAWTILASRLKQVTFQHITQGTYQPSTGTVSQSVTTTTLKCFLLDFELEQIGGTDILSSDLRAIIRVTDLSAAGEGDKLTDHRGIVWNVMSVRGDPDFYYDLVLRR